MMKQYVGLDVSQRASRCLYRRSARARSLIGLHEQE